MPRILSSEFRIFAIIAFITSLLLSAWSVFLDDVINNDGVEYVRAATAILQGDWRAAQSIYKWPVYPVLLALISGTLGTNPEIAAYVLNATLTAITVCAYLGIIVQLGGDRRTLLIGTIVILLFPTINDFRSFVVRDPGYLAFYLLSALYLFHYLQRPGIREALASIVFMAIATLFRIEGAVFLLFIITYFLSHRMESRLRRGLLLIMMPMLGGLLVVIFGWWIFVPELSLMEEPATIIQNAWQQVSIDFNRKISVIQRHLLGPYSAGYAYILLIVATGLIVVAASVANLTILHALLVGYALRQRVLFPLAGGLRVWTALILVNLSILFVFTVAKLFLTDRYPLAMALTILVAVPFSLVLIYDEWKSKQGHSIRKNWLFPVAASIVLIMGVEGLDVSTSKRHVKAAGQWLAANTPPDSLIYTNEKLIAYYSGRELELYGYAKDHRRFVGRIKRVSRKHDFLVLRDKTRDQNRLTMLRDQLKLVPIKTFSNKKGDQILIYDTRARLR